MRAARVSDLDLARENLAEVEREIANPVGITDDQRQKLEADAEAYRQRLTRESN